MSEAELKLPLEIEDIKAILPHRSPFLFLDRILELEPDRRIVGLKNVTSNERYFIAGPGGVPTLPILLRMRTTSASSRTWSPATTGRR